MSRIVLLIDMDCFYVQVDQRSRPETLGKPCAVAQYNGETGGGIIAVSYEARAKGVKRGMWGRTANTNCPDLILFEVPEKRGKADLTKYRAASAEVFECISEYFTNVERASIDEAYIDLTDIVSSKFDIEDYVSSLKASSPNSETFSLTDSGSTTDGSVSTSLDRSDWLSFLLNQSPDGMRYAIASALTYEVRQAILKRTGFRCSAGIAPNKTLAKLACSLNKPNKQTIVVPECATLLLHSTPISKVRNLGGKLGAAVQEEFGCETIGDLAQIGLDRLTESFGEKTAQWLFELCQGHDSETVTPRSIAQSVGCGKNFVGRSTLTSVYQTEQWLRSLATDLIERLTDDRKMHRRHATRLTFHARVDAPIKSETATSSKTSFSRVLSSAPLSSIAGDLAFDDESDEVTSHKPPTSPTKAGLDHRIAMLAIDVLNDVLHVKSGSDTWPVGITALALSAGKFRDDAAESCDIRTHLGKKRPVDESVNTPEVITTVSTTSSEQKDTADSRSSFFKRLRIASGPVTQSHDSGKEDKRERSTSIERETPVFVPAEDDADSRSSSKSEPATYFTSYAAGDWVVCDQCGSRVSVWQFPEHSDFHVAQRLQHEWSGEQNNTNAPTPKKTKAPTTTRRSAKPKSATTSRTLDKFFVRAFK